MREEKHVYYGVQSKPWLLYPMANQDMLWFYEFESPTHFKYIKERNSSIRCDS